MLAFKSKWFPVTRDNGAGSPNDCGQLGAFFADTDQHLHRNPPVPRIERGLAEKAGFYAANALLLLILVSLYTHVVSEGLRFFAPVLATEAYKLPIPGFAIFEKTDGWDRLDVAQLTAVLVFLQLWPVWSWIVKPDTKVEEPCGWYEWLEDSASSIFLRVLAAMPICIEFGLLFIGILEVVPRGLCGDPIEAAAYMALYCLFVRFQIARWHHRFRYGG